MLLNSIFLWFQNIPNLVHCKYYKKNFNQNPICRKKPNEIQKKSHKMNSENQIAADSIHVYISNIGTNHHVFQYGVIDYSLTEITLNVIHGFH